jgi:hypothetical protein
VQKRDAVTAALDSDEASVIPEQALENSPIRAIKATYDPKSGNLLGFVLDMAYDEATIVTCDAWKQNCGGVPKNSFVLMQVNASASNLSPSWKPKPSLILGRVKEAVGTPVSSDVQQTVFSIHKLQAVVDPYTNAELQWSALKVAILGTYYDDGETIQFGNDIDSYIPPHFYEVYVPTKGDLNTLINSFVDHEHPYEIGELRYTETQTNVSQGEVSIQVSPLDFIANRTALFGKTRMGKSNTIKVIADMMIRSGENVGQVILT